MEGPHRTALAKPRRFVSLMIAVATVTAPLCVVMGVGVVAAPAGATSLGSCQPDNPTLAPAPVPPPNSGVVLPMRTDPDGTITETLLVEDPVDPVATDYSYTGAAGAGIFTHPWPAAPQVTTIGLYLVANGQSIRVPLLLTENLPPDLMGAVEEVLGQEYAPVMANSTPFAANTLGTPETLAYVLSLVTKNPSFSANDNEYPYNEGFSDLPTAYFWTTYRTAPGQQYWEGTAVTHDGTFKTDGLGDYLACRESRIGEAVRTNAATTFVSGAFVQETASSTNTETLPGSFAAEETIVSGTTTDATGTWADVPVAEVSQNEQKSGQFQYVVQPDQQSDTIAVGVVVNGSFIPLVGTQSNDANGTPPNAENHLVSLGVYDPLGAYHSVIGVRSHFDNYSEDEWLYQWAFGGDAGPVSSGGPGAQFGGWSIDAGIFDPFGAFIPVLGATYSQVLPGALYPYDMLMTVGPWVAASEVGTLGGPNLAGDQYKPLIGATYDGAQPLIGWENANRAGAFSAMGPWLASVGGFSPLGSYVPIAGASYSPGATSSSTPVVEKYQIGGFAAQYPDFVPVAEARWSSTSTSEAWAMLYVNAAGVVPGPAELDVGAVLPDGTFEPIAVLTATPGSPDTYGVGVWAEGNFIPLLKEQSPIP